MDLGVPFAGDGDHAGAEVTAFEVDDDGVAEEHFGGGIFLEEFDDGGEGAGKELVVAIEVGAEVACGAGEAAVDGVIHSGVGFGEDFERRCAADGGGLMADPSGVTGRLHGASN